METHWFDELKALSEVPSVATACGPVTGVLRRLLPGYDFLEVPDGFFLAYPTGSALEELRVLYVTHVDEIGGWVLMPEGDGRFGAWLIGNRPEAFAGTPLQAFRYDAVDAGAAIPCVGEVTEVGATHAGGAPAHSPLRSFPERGGDEARLLLRGDGLEPFTMFWTFREELRVEGDRISGKALDPRVTVYCAVAAARRLGRRDLGLLFCYAEECSRGPAQKAYAFCRRALPALEVVVNADVPGTQNIAGVGPDEVAIRPIEGWNLIDPTFSLSLYERLRVGGVAVKLTVAASGSQTATFVPLARTISIALPSVGVHQARVEMSVRGMTRCTDLLAAIGEQV
jgi:putative aminopeptidase FrvX